MSTRVPLARRLIAALLLVLVTACYSWRPTTVSPQTLIATEQPSSVRATLTNGEVVTVQSPIMRNDSIVGATDASVAAVASRDVRLLEVRQFELGPTIGVVVLSVVGGVLLYALILCIDDPCPSNFLSSSPSP